MSLMVDRSLIYRFYDDSDDEDRDDFLVKEIRCCDCFFDKIISIIDGKSEVSFEILYKKLRVAPRRYVQGDVYLFFSETSIFCCEKSKVIFERVCEVDKEKMDENCLAPSIDYCCLYFLSRESWIRCICEGCRRTILKIVSERLIKIKI